ncbi:MAG: ABC transporter permease [Desulfobacterota bacterium]|nr:ABC transporter permease [Thermodesulfobacteriota bacterium]
MLLYCLKRFIGMIPVFFGVTLLSFVIIQLAPGKPTDRLTELNPRITPEARARLEQYYGLDKPIIVQYGRWLSRIVRFDFGVSFSSDARPVIDKIWDRSVPFFDRRLTITFLINTLSLFLILAVAIPIGVLAAYRPYSLTDRITSVAVFIGFAAPKFWVALLLMMVFSVQLGWLPISGIKSLNYAMLTEPGQFFDRIRHLVLPVFVSACGGIAGMSRYMRSSMREALSHDYITTARAKGLSETAVLYRHALRNALLPLVTLLGLSVPGFFAGSVIFETIFGIPGMGQLSYQAIMMRDYPVIMGLLCITALLTMIGNLLADICYAYIDPRIRVK